MPDPVYAIGDIHGRLAMLEEALARIDKDDGRALSAAVFEGPDCWVLTDDGRVPLAAPG